MHTLQTLQILGLDPASEAARRAIALVAEHGRWEHAGQRYFDGEVEPCINGRTIETGAYFGVDVAAIVERILGERLADGGWNCEAENGSVRSSFDTTIDVLDGLLEFERATGGSAAVSEARRGGEQYLLERGLFRRKSTGEVVDPAYLDFAFPYYWRYDVLRALDYFRRAGADPDPRMAEAVEVVRSKRQPDGRWLLDRIHPGRVHFDLEDGVGAPSRWNTLRALRVLDWWDRGRARRREGSARAGELADPRSESGGFANRLVGERLLPVWVEVLHEADNTRRRRRERAPKACAFVDGNVAGALRAREQRDGLDVGRRSEPRRTAAAIHRGPARRDPVQPSAGRRPTSSPPDARAPRRRVCRRPERTTSPSRGATLVHPRATRGGRECQGCRWRRPHRPSSTAGAPTVRAHRPGMLAGGLRPRWAELPTAWST